MKKDRSKARILDQFYTNPIYAADFLKKITSKVDLATFDVLLEPSAGNGSFYNLMDPSKRVGIDLEPKAPGIIQHDFLTWIPPLNQKIASIGNPPFGKNSNLAVKFFNKAAEFSDVIAFIIPKTFRKASIINRLSRNHHLIFDEDVPEMSFIFDNKPYDVWCCAQIWVKKETKRSLMPIAKLSDVQRWFEVVPADRADFAIQRVGGGAGEIKVVDFKKYSPLSNYFIKAHRPEVLDIFKKIDFNSVKFNTAGNPSISANEIVSLWIESASKQGIDYQEHPLFKKVNN